MTDISNLLTDYLLASGAAVLGVLLLGSGNLPARLWGCAFLAAALAALAGGTWHGFQRMLGEAALFWLWKGVIYGVAVFGLAATAGSILSAASGSLRRALLATIIAATAVYAVLMATRDGFAYVIYYGATAMGLVLAVHLYAGVRRRDPAAPWMAAGFVVSAIGAVVQRSGVPLHDHFDHNDLFHLIQLAGFYLLYRGARRLEAATGPA